MLELISGKRPFDAPSSREVVTKILTAKLSCPAALKKEPDLWGILDRGLAKAPEERWRNMNDLGRALAAWAMARGVACDASGASLAACWLTPPRRGA
jgi:serine/threonine-protein kinase